MSTGGPENTGTESGAGTLIGDNMGPEDPFNGRHNVFNQKKHNRNSLSIVALGRKNSDIMQIEDSDGTSNAGSMMSGNFGGIVPIRTPGFKNSKNFAFGEESETLRMTDGDSDDDISSMHSDFLKFGGGKNRHKSFGSSHRNDSDSSSEMEAKSDFSEDIQRDYRKKMASSEMETQTEPV